MRSSVKMLAVLLIIGMLFSACGENGMTDPVSGETARVNFSVVVNSSSTTRAASRALVNIGTLVTSGTIRLSRGALVQYVNLSISGLQASAVVPNLLVGNWHADVQLYDKDGLIIYSGSADFQIFNGVTTQNIELTLTRHEGTALFGFTLPTETSDILVLWNKLGSTEEIMNSVAGPALIPGTATTFTTGKWGNGVDCGSNTGLTNTVTIPGGTIPMSDFSIEFWYTKTSDFNNGDLAHLLFTGDNSLNHTNNLTIHLRTPWDLSDKNGGVLYPIVFGVRINNDNEKQVYLAYDFGSIAALNSAFPLNTPVHIAVTKRNSDGRMQIFLNGSLLPAVYINCWEPYFTDDLSQIANKSGFFPFETYIGNTHAIRGNNPAKGTIDNLKIYDAVLDNFFFSNE